MILILEKIRIWKNSVFPDWVWDVLVGGGLAEVGLLGLIINTDCLILAIPFIVTIINQIYNKIFEPKDFILRMAIPIILYVIL